MVSSLIAAAFIAIIILDFVQKMGPTTEKVNPLEQLGDRLHDGSQSTENLLLNILMS